MTSVELAVHILGMEDSTQVFFSCLPVIGQELWSVFLVRIWFLTFICFILPALPPHLLTPGSMRSPNSFQTLHMFFSLLLEKSLSEPMSLSGGVHCFCALGTELYTQISSCHLRDCLFFLSVIDHLFPGWFCLVLFVVGLGGVQLGLQHLGLSGPSTSVSLGAGTKGMCAPLC